VLLSEYRLVNLRWGENLAWSLTTCPLRTSLDKGDSLSEKDLLLKDLVILQESYQAYCDGLKDALDLLDVLMAGNNNEFTDYVTVSCFISFYKCLVF